MGVDGARGETGVASLLRRRAAAGAAALVFVALLAWSAVGFTRVDGERELGVLEFGFGQPVRVASDWSWAPPGLARLERYPRGPIELTLPDAARSGLVAADGSPIGYRGRASIELDPEDWRSFHEAASGRGAWGVLVESLREAVPEADASTVPLTAAAARRLERALAATLERHGATLLELSVEALEHGSVAADELAPVAATRLLVVGLDGADWSILDPLLEAGRLPNLERLVREGTRARLLTTSPMLSPVIWTSIATGVEPTRHGILDFVVTDEVTGESVPVTSAQRAVPAVWEILSRRGVDVGVVGWWASWPADPVRGYVVSDRLAYQLFGYRADPADGRGKTWPAELYREIRPLLVEPASVGWDRVAPYLDGDARADPGAFTGQELELVEGFRTLVASGESYLAIARALSARYEPRFEAVYFEGTDTVGHLFMPYRPPLLPGIDPRRAEAFGSVIDRYYETADDYLGRLLEGRDASWTVMVLSDHGFATDATRPHATDSRVGHGAAADWHRRFGVLILAGPSIRRGVTLDEARIYDIAPTVLALYGQPVPESWPGRVLAEALSESFLAEHPVRYRADTPDRGERSVAGAADDPSASDWIAKLEALGYVGGDGSAAAPAARMNAGIALLADGRTGEAEAVFRALVAEHPEAPLGWLNLGLTLRLLGRDDEAQPLLERAAGHPLTQLVAGVQLSDLLAAKGELEEAERVVRRVLVAEPQSAEARNTLGLVLEARGLTAEARGEFEHAAELDPELALAPNNLGNLHAAAGRPAEAEVWYRRAIEADPYFIGAYNNLALIHQERGAIATAMDLYDRALERDPDHAVVLNNLASLCFATGDAAEARALWERAAAADPEYASPPSNLAGLAIQEGRLDDAGPLLDRALAIDPGYGDARINRAILLRRRGRDDEARQELGRAAEDPRAAAGAWTELGLLELASRRPAEAAAALEHAVRVAPDELGSLNALGDAYRLLGRPADARELWRRSLALDPAQPALRAALAALERAGAGG